MITFKCKMCGGDLTFEPGASAAECPYCGTGVAGTVLPTHD